MRKPTLDSFQIAMAIQAVRSFAKEKSGDSVNLQDHDIVGITICWREGVHYEWTPCSKGF